MSSQGGQGIRALINDGAGHFTAGTTSNPGGPVRGILALDLDGDHQIDVAAVGNVGTAAKLWILPKTGTNTTVELGAFTAFALAAGDFNEDGFPDLAVGMIGAGGPVILLNDGTGHFAGSTALTTGSNPLTLIVKDFNEDGHADLAVGHRDQS